MSASAFEPVTRRTISTEIRERLAEAIHNGDLVPGAPLPAERLLCQEFGVARNEAYRLAQDA